jgi:hypothetical protein
VLAICDFDMRFTFVVASWPGAAHDTHILNHTLVNFPLFPVPLKVKVCMVHHFLHFTLVVLVLFILFSLVYFYRKIISRGFGLSKPNRVFGILHLTKEAHITYPNFDMIQALLKESMRCSISCIHPFKM